MKENHEIAKKGNSSCEFKYELSGAGWAHLYMRINESEFFIHVSYAADSIEDIMLALYCLIPCEKLGDEDYFLPKKVNKTLEGYEVFIDAEKGGEYYLYFNTSVREKDRLKVIVKSESGRIVINETCSLNDFTYAVVKACDEMLKAYGLLGYSRTYLDCTDCHFDAPVFLVLKAYCLHVEGYGCTSDEKGIFKKSDYEKELAILAMEM